MMKSCRSVVEEAIEELLCHKERIEELVPCKVTIHLPPPEGKDDVVLEIIAKLRG